MTATRYITNRKAKWIAAGLCLIASLLVLSAHEAASAKDAQGLETKGPVGPKTKPSGPQPIPKELLAEFITAVKKTPEYRVCGAMKVTDELRRTIEQWSKELGLEIEIETRDSLHAISDHYGPYGKRITVGDKSYELFRESNYGRERYIVDWLDSVDWLGRKARDPWYCVSHAELAELSFVYADVMVIRDPADVRLKTFSVREKNLLSVVEHLCQLGKLDNFSIRTDLLSSAYVSLNLRNRTVADCLEFAGRAAGFRVTYGPLRRKHDDGPLEADFRPPDVRLYVLGYTLGPNVYRDAEEPVKKPIDILREKVFREGKKLLENRPVMVLEPIRETPQTAGK